MKSFACGDVVPGCDARFVCSSEDEVLRQVAQHAGAVHGMSSLPSQLVLAVRSKMVTTG